MNNVGRIVLGTVRRLHYSPTWAAKRNALELDRKLNIIVEIAEEGDRITVKGVPEEEGSGSSTAAADALQEPHFAEHACILCRLGLKFNYAVLPASAHRAKPWGLPDEDDVLILEQFMRPDGTVLPKEVTGLCMKQQQRVERAVMQAHWSGLFPTSPPPQGYRKMKRYWTDDREVLDRRLEVKEGSWFYIQRYEKPVKRYEKEPLDPLLS